MKKIFLLITILISIKASAQLNGITIPSGHSSGTKEVKLDASTKFLFSSDYEHVIMWNVKTGTQLYTFPALGDIYDFAISPNGSQLVITTQYHSISYNTVTGKQLWQTRDLDYYKAVIFSNDGVSLLGVRNVGMEQINPISIINPSTGKKTGDIVNNTESKGLSKFFKIDDNQIVLTNTGTICMINNDLKIISTHTIPKDGDVESYLPGRKQFVIAYKGKHRNSEYALTSIKGENLIDLKSEDEYKSLGWIIPATSGDSFITIRPIEDSYTHEAWRFSGTAPTKTKLPWRFTGKQIITGGLINGETGKSYLNGGNEIVELDLKSGKQDQVFKREVADLGSASFNSMEYNYLNGKLNIMTEDSLYKSVDLLKMKPYRHVNTSLFIEMVAYSPGGDTIGVFSESNSYLKNIVTGKKILASIPGSKGASSIDSKWFFFNKTGTKVFFVTFDVPTQKSTLKSYNLVTKVLQTVMVSRNFNDFAIHPDKTIIAYKEGSTLDYTIKVLNVETGKLLLSLPLKNKGVGNLFLSADKKQILLANSEFGLRYYSVLDGKQIIQPNSGERKNGFYTSSTMSANPSLSMLVTGDDVGSISSYDVNGTAIYHKQIHTGGVRTILFSPDYKIMYTVSYDQTIKALKVATGEVLGTLYLFNDGNDYVFIGEDGRFDGSNGGIKRLYYIKNREKIALDLVYEKFYTPNLYQRLVNGEVFDQIDINIKSAPKVKIAYAEIARNLTVEDDGIPTYQNTTGAAEITITANAPDDAVDEIRLFQNGKILNLVTRNLIVADDKTTTAVKKYTISLLPGQNTIRAVALNTQRTESNPDEILVNYSAVANTTPVVTKPVSSNEVVVSAVNKDATLHLIVVGINEYQNKSMSLNYALADATAFKDEVEKDAKTILGTVKTYFVTNTTADKSGITTAFKEVQQNAKPQDVFIFYYAGHGVIGKDKEFYLVPTDVSDLKNVQTELEQKGIASKLLQQYAIDIPAQKQLFILDACQSAGAFEKLLSNSGEQQKSLAVVARSTGTHWMAASGAMQFANEFSSLGHGVFTYVLLKALKGEAANNKMITVNGLKNFLQQGVPALMKKYNGAEQYPASYGFGNDFPVELIK